MLCYVSNRDTGVKREVYDRMKRDFNMGMFLESGARKNANAIIEIGRYAIKEKIPLCFGRTYGHNSHLSFEEKLLSPIYFYPKV